jgi:hypothetical protein
MKGIRVALVICALSVAVSFSALGVPKARAAGNVLRMGSLNPLITKEGLEQKKWHEL